MHLKILVEVSLSSCLAAFAPQLVQSVLCIHYNFIILEKETRRRATIDDFIFFLLDRQGRGTRQEKELLEFLLIKRIEVEKYCFLLFVMVASYRNYFQYRLFKIDSAILIFPSFKKHYLFCPLHIQYCALMIEIKTHTYLLFICAIVSTYVYTQ